MAGWIFVKTPIGSIAIIGMASVCLYITVHSVSVNTFATIEGKVSGDASSTRISIEVPAGDIARIENRLTAGTTVYWSTKDEMKNEAVIADQTSLQDLILLSIEVENPNKQQLGDGDTIQLEVVTGSRSLIQTLIANGG
ncbi:hypothetical protein SAMN02799630_05928 [Paenibacillus sp. UNCCL117]|uniref:hypothetical protein n=1 Tax=unclassified Paenibacillus TaxID=185978 RepID=UPI00088C3DBE|nr:MULTISPECIES: hypothetical protein [unclassified Paenibacillus]SDE61612.1 hypothetical protein SAMN04488602_1369 [Paenibacillus sp. cl123]SFW69789.1 hypothetical protein SAMN02799630_05928 [Paenibacillus sp. UNCCL117]